MHMILHSTGITYTTEPTKYYTSLKKPNQNKDTTVQKHLNINHSNPIQPNRKYQYSTTP